MTPSSRSGQVQPILAVALGAVAIVGLVAAILVFRPGPASAPTASGRPSSPPASAPIATPPATPAATPTPAPTNAPSGGGDGVALVNATDHDVVAQVHDQTDSLVEALSGHPGDGMSVRWHKATVTNTGPNTVSVTWAGLPQDDTVDVGVALVAGRLRITIVQAGPVPNSDAMGEDRAISLTFNGLVSASDFDVEVLDRTVD